MNRKSVIIGLLAVLFSLVVVVPAPLYAQRTRPLRGTLEATLSDLPGVTSVTPLESEHFKEKYVLTVHQMVKPSDLRYGFFEQRVFVMHAGSDRPTVLVTEGYGADYAARPRYTNELARLLEANIVVVEHRYFSESTPIPRRWEYLTGELAMGDLHVVRELLSTVYTGKWIATGVSKGGQTALMYRTLYPKDVDVTVSYVGPLCRDVEDGRHEVFLKDVGTPQERNTILAFQRELLLRKDSLMIPFAAHCKEAGYTFLMTQREVFDYCVLEYPFAHWQYGTPVSAIPPVTASDSTLLAHLLRVASPDYFMRDTPNLSFFVQAASQLGYYGYDTSPFKFKINRTWFKTHGALKAKSIARKNKKWQEKAALDSLRAAEYLAKVDTTTGEWVTKDVPVLDVKSTKGYLKKYLLPDFYQPHFNNKLYKRQLEFVQTTTEPLIFIYGENDPWTAAAVPNPNRPNVLYMVQPGGHHGSSILGLPDQMRQQVLDQLKAWLEE